MIIDASNGFCFLDTIARNAKRLQRLTENILDITRIESHSLQLNKEQMNLNEVILNLLADYGIQNSKELRNVKLLFTPQKENIILVEVDRERLGQIFINLLSNAIKFPKEGTIHIR